jgi:putative flippase GtrA
MQKINNIKFKFLATGFINTLLGMTLGYLFISMLPFHYSISLLLAQFLGVIFNYFTYASWTFKKEISLSRFFIFFGIYISLYFLTASFISLLSIYEIKPENAFLIFAPIGVILSFFLQKNLVFND